MYIYQNSKLLVLVSSALLNWLNPVYEHLSQATCTLDFCQDLPERNRMGNPSNVPKLKIR